MKDITHFNLWRHETPESAIYWLFVDTAQFGDKFKSTFLIINEKDDINFGLSFVYDEEILELKNLKVVEIYEELYSLAFGKAESEIKASLMKKYENLTQNGLWGDNNIYNYVFKDYFQLSPVVENQLLFTDEEIAKITQRLNAFDNYEIKPILERTLITSKRINELQETIK